MTSSFQRNLSEVMCVTSRLRLLRSMLYSLFSHSINCITLSMSKKSEYAFSILSVVPPTRCTVQDTSYIKVKSYIFHQICITCKEGCSSGCRVTRWKEPGSLNHTLRKSSYHLVILTLDYYMSIFYWGKPMKYKVSFVTAARFALTDPRINTILCLCLSVFSQ